MDLWGKEWHVDLIIEVEQVQSWRLWLWEDKTLAELELGPRRVEVASDKGLTRLVSFFAYSARIGRRALGRLLEKAPTWAQS